MLGLLAHGFHLLLVVVGLVGVAFTSSSPRRRRQRAPLVVRRSARRRDPTEHEQRVDALRAAVQTGQLTAPDEPLVRPPPQVARDSSTWRGLAVGSSVAAAGAHAADFPHHLEEAWYVGVFLLVVTLAQAAWACLVWLDATRGRVLVAGIVANLGLIVLWSVSRTVGLPFGLGREAVGGWDLASPAGNSSSWPRAWWDWVGRPRNEHW